MSWDWIKDTNDSFNEKWQDDNIRILAHFYNSIGRDLDITRVHKHKGKSYEGEPIYMCPSPNLEDETVGYSIFTEDRIEEIKLDIADSNFYEYNLDDIHDWYDISDYVDLYDLNCREIEDIADSWDYYEDLESACEALTDVGGDCEDYIEEDMDEDEIEDVINVINDEIRDRKLTEVKVEFESDLFRAVNKYNLWLSDLEGSCITIDSTAIISELIAPNMELVYELGLDNPSNDYNEFYYEGETYTIIKVSNYIF
jgi:hypothetical protein